MNLKPLPYFGWVKPSASGGGKLDISIEGNPLTAEQYKEVLRLMKFVAWVRPFLIDYLVLDSWYGEIVRLPEHLGDKLARHPNLIEKTGTFLIQSHVIVEKAVNGFFSAAATFRDRLLARTNSRKGSELQCFTSELYDAEPAYRLGYNLRNFGLHSDAIIHAIPMRRSGTDEVEVEVTIAISRDRLIRSLDVNERVRTDLGGMPSSIDLLALCETYQECMAQIFAKLLTTRAEELAFAFGLANVLRNGARGLPKDATPILFLEPPSGEADDKFEFTSKTELFSLDELSILADLFPALRS